MAYLDWAASSLVKYFSKDYYIPGNPNSPHVLGLQANKALDEARDRIMKCLGVRSGKVLFCRCATEAVEWLCRNFKGMDYTTCSFTEHDSVYNICDSKVCPEEILDKGWIYSSPLYLHQYTNHITGTVFPIESIGKQVQSTGVFFGSDFTAAIGHYPLPDNLESFCSAAWFSGHKFGCESGIGAIWLSDRLFKYLSGSEDSRNNYGLLHGTSNVSSAVAMSYAMEHAINNVEKNMQYWEKLVDQMMNSLAASSINALIHNNLKMNKTWAINAVYLHEINADALVQFLSSKDIYISPGHSACAENDDYRVLEAFNLTKEEASQTVRISFGEDTTQEDVDALVKGIVEFKKLFI